MELTCGVFSQHYELVVTRLPFNERAMLGSNRLSDTPVGWPHIVDANAETIGQRDADKTPCPRLNSVFVGRHGQCTRVRKFSLVLNLYC